MVDEVFKTVSDDAKGENEVKRVACRFGLPEFESIVDFRSRNASSTLLRILNILPTTTADCERGFSDMNLTITDLRARLTIENVSDLMFISINGPPVADFNPRPYVKIWLQDHRSASSAPRGKVTEHQKADKEDDASRKTFFINIFN